MAINTFVTRAALAMLTVGAGQADALKLTGGILNAGAKISSPPTSTSINAKANGQENLLTWTEKSRNGGKILSSKTVPSHLWPGQATMASEWASLFGTSYLPSHVEVTTNPNWKAENQRHAAQKIAKKVYRRDHTLRNAVWYKPINLDGRRLDNGRSSVHVTAGLEQQVYSAVLVMAKQRQMSYNQLYDEALKQIIESPARKISRKQQTRGGAPVKDPRSGTGASVNDPLSKRQGTDEITESLQRLLLLGTSTPKGDALNAWREKLHRKH